MMRSKSLILLALALSCGLVAAKGISQVLDSNNQKQVVVESVPIYVALQNINLGDPVDESMLSLQEWPKDKIPVGAITKWEDIEDRRPRTTIFAGEPLLDSKFLEKGQSQDPISSIPEGMRLKTVSVDARKSAAGLLSPGDRVDVQIFVKRNERMGISRPFTKIILQNIRVFAVDQAVQRAADGLDARTVAKTVSLVVTPEQANKMLAAENLGEISLIPRHPDDDQIVHDEETTTEFLFGKSEANSREQEQQSGSDKTDRVQPPAGDGEVVYVQPNFQMKLIYPDEVDVVEFSNETGEPIYDDQKRNQNLDLGNVPFPQGFSGDDDDDVDEIPDEIDFPIDLKL